MTEPVSSAPASPRIRKKRQRRQAQILHAALAAFRERGYHTTTLDDIAERLGVQKTALYHYFPDKDAILFACHRRSLAQLSGHLAEARRRHRSAADRLRYIVLEHVRVITDSVDGSPLAFEVPAMAAPLQQRAIAARDRYERGLRDIITEGVQRGEFGAVNPKIATFLVLGAINWIARWYQPRGTIDPSDLGHQYADQLLGGLVCPPQP